LDQLAAFDAARLFLDRAETSGADLVLETTNGPAIAEICRRLDGIPLAIELAAARVIALGPGEIAAHLDERFRLLTGGRRAAVERHHTLRAAIDWSYSLLSQQDRAVFDHLGVFPASFDAAAAQAVAAAGAVEPWDVLDALTSLVAKSMLNADRSGAGPTRYQMLESLRHYARERLDATGGTDDARRCHARHYAAAAAAIGPGLIGPEELSWREGLYADVDNFRAAVAWSLDSVSEEDGEFAMVILGELALSGVAGRSGLFAGADEQAVERARRAGPRYSSLVLGYAAVNAFARGDLRRGRQLAREALQGVRVSPHPGRVYSASFIFVDPQRLDEEVTAAVQVLNEVGAELWEYAQVHVSAAGMAAALGNVELALQEVPVALEISRRIGNPTLLALVLYALGLASWQSDLSAAQAALEEHIQIVRATGHEVLLPRVLALLAQLRARSSDLPAAVQTLQDALQRAHMNGDRPAMAVCLARGAVVVAALGDLESAVIFLGAVTDGALARLGALPSNELPTHNEFVRTLRSQLGDDHYTAATAQGAAMTYEQAGANALAVIEHLLRNQHLA
jgi:predicted ATPase